MVIAKDPKENYLKQKISIIANKKIQIIPRFLIAQIMSQKQGDIMKDWDPKRIKL